MGWNLDEIRNRYARWWGPEQAGPLVYVEVLRTGARERTPWPAWVRGDSRFGLVHDWLAAREAGRAGGMDGLLRATLDGFAATRYAGDGYPRINLNLGPGSMAAHLTGFLAFSQGTSWFELREPMAWDDIMRLEVRDDNRWWAVTKELTAYLARESRGRYTVGYPDLGGLMDVLASLRTSNQLLEDLTEEPERVREAMGVMLRLWHAYYDELSRILADAGQAGTGSWMELWCPKRWYPVQCDIAAMLSPAMFAEFVLPTLAEHCARLDHAIFHWDGPGQIRHLDHLLGIGTLAGIQWVPGTGQPGQEAERWFPYYERILKAGKRLVLNYLAPASVPGIIDRFGGKGLFLQAWCSREDELLDLAGKLRLPLRD